MGTVLRKRHQARASELFSGVWHNQHNSEMSLQIDEGGLIRGAFKPGVGAQGSESKEYSLTGYACNDVIALAVAFEEYGCVTSWSGQLSTISEDDNVPTLYCMWNMSVDVGDDAETSLWKSMICGADRFVRGHRKSNVNSLKTASSDPLWLHNERQFAIDEDCYSYE